MKKGLAGVIISLLAVVAVVFGVLFLNGSLNNDTRVSELHASLSGMEERILAVNTELNEKNDLVKALTEEAGDLQARVEELDSAVTTRDILLNDETVSRNNHAVVAFYAATEQFFCAGGDARELFSLNNEPVLETRILKKGDILTIGKTKLMFVPFCGEMYHWGMNKD